MPVGPPLSVLASQWEIIGLASPETELPVRPGGGKGNSSRRRPAFLLALRSPAPNSQNTAIGFSGDPVPPRIGSGAAISMNSQRLRSAAASPSASRSQLSNM